MAGPQIVFQMQGLTKAYAGGKKVFENIHLNFLPDAKIGVVGVNGSGKSTLCDLLLGLFVPTRTFKAKPGRPRA